MTIHTDRYRCKPLLMGLLLLAAALTACALNTRADKAGSRSINSEALIADLTPDIEALYLSWHSLNQIYKDIKFLERGFLFDPNDRQLGYIQKAALYLQDALLRIHHQWENLSVLHYIRPEMIGDYVTLSVNGLTSSLDEIGYDQKFMEIYAAFIAHDAVVEDINRARVQIEKTLEVMNRVRHKLLPVSNATLPPDTL